MVLLRLIDSDKVKYSETGPPVSQSRPYPGGLGMSNHFTYVRAKAAHSPP